MFNTTIPDTIETVRAAVIPVAAEVMKEVFLLEGMTVMDGFWDAETRTFNLVVSAPWLPQTSPGIPLPRINPLYSTRHYACGHQKVSRGLMDGEPLRPSQKRKR